MVGLGNQKTAELTEGKRRRIWAVEEKYLNIRKGTWFENERSIKTWLA
jgi:hypothetical protein